MGEATCGVGVALPLALRSQTTSTGKCKTGNLSPRNISSLATPICSSNLAPEWSATIAIAQGGATRLTMRAGGIGEFAIVR
jgi:hypothetical protein